MDELSTNDPRVHSGEKFKQPVFREVRWRVEAWNDYVPCVCEGAHDPTNGQCNPSVGGSVTYAAVQTGQQAEAQARQLMEHGDHNGRKYQHYALSKVIYETEAWYEVYDLGTLGTE